MERGTFGAENKWGYWHPYLPFLGDEVTGKTIGIQAPVESGRR